MLALISMLWLSIAFANIDVTCIDENCLVSGWTTTDLMTRRQTDSICVNEDCMTQGWVTESNGFEIGRAQCKSGLCFNLGWLEIDPRFQRIVADVQCIRSFLTTDCLVNGWTVDVPGRPQVVTRCVESDCQNNGWDVYSRGYRMQSVRCKEGGCFVAGWEVHR